VGRGAQLEEVDGIAGHDPPMLESDAALGPGRLLGLRSRPRWRTA